MATENNKKGLPPDFSKKVMDLIKRMEDDLNREMQIQEQAERAFQRLEGPGVQIMVCLN